MDNGWARRQEQKQRREGATLDEAVNEGNGADDEHRGEDGIETSAQWRHARGGGGKPNNTRNISASLPRTRVGFTATLLPLPN